MLQTFISSNHKSKLINSFIFVIIVKFKNPIIKTRFKILEIKTGHQEGNESGFRYILTLE